MSPDQKTKFLSDLTRLILLARTGESAPACHLLGTLLEWVAPDDSDWGIQQKQMLKMARVRYALSPHVKPAPAPEGANLAIPIDDWVKEIKSGVSLVTCCMNRSENLLKALPSWIDCPEINQIIIVDWGSKASVRDEVKEAGFNDSRILVARVNSQPRWILSYAFNFGFRIAAYDKILKTDADIIIRSEFFKRNDLRPGTFLSGDWRTAEKGQEHINGFFHVRRADLLSIKGFNEYITTYGWDDDDIYFRLEQHGFNRVRIKTDGVYHIPHGDAQRIGGGQPPKNALEELRLDTGAKIMGNRFLASAMPMWNVDRIFVPFVIKSHSNGYLEAEQSGQSYHQVPAHVRADVDYYGLATALSWTTELTAYFIPKDRLYALLEDRTQRAEITRADVRLAASLPGNTIDWYPRVLILEFDNEIPAEQRVTLAKNLLNQVQKIHVTLVLPLATFDRIGKVEVSNGVQSLLAWPEGFHTHQLPEGKLESLDNLKQAFEASPVLVVRLSAKDMPHFVSSSQPVPAGRDRLYVHVQHGLGNRLRAMASAMAIANATDRELIVVWTPDHHCDCQLSDLFEYDGVVLTEIDEASLCRADQYTYMEIEPGACKDAPIKFNEGRDLYIRTAYVINNEHSNWQSENVALRTLKPVKAVMSLVNSVEAEGRLGVHIRMEGAVGTDHNSYDASDNWLPESHRELNLWRGKSHYTAFMNRIDQKSVEQPGLKVFLAADTSETYKVFTGSYGERVSYLPRKSYDRSLLQLRYALADAILLGQCSEMLGSTWSSFSELARRFSVTLEKIEMSGVDF